MRTYNYSMVSCNEGTKNDIILQQMEEGFKAIHSHAESSARAFYCKLATQMPIWINDYTCYHHVDSIFKLNSQVKAFTEELVDGLERKVRRETNEWVQQQFVPLVEREINTLALALNAQTQSYGNHLSQMYIPMDINRSSIVKSTTPSTGNRVLSTTGAILIGDLGGAIMGGAGGSDAMFKTMGCEFGAGVLLGIISIFTPVGLAALVASVIISAFVGGNWALSSVEKDVRKTLAKKCKESINSTESMDNFLNTVRIKLDDFLDKIRTEVSQNLQVLPMSA